MLAPPPPPPSLLKRVLDAFSPKPPPARPFQEMGVGGQAVFGGYVATRERSSQWAGAQRYVTISDMAVNASIVGAGVHYFLNLIAHPQWTIEPAEGEGVSKSEAQRAADFVDECLNDLVQPWSRVVRRAGTYRFYGFGVQEWTAKRRPDGRVGLAGIEARPQSTVERWSVTPSGEVEGVWQRSPQTGEALGIPRRKLLYLVDDVLTDSPEGVGIFRHLAEPWERLKQYYALEARAFERDLRGTPVGRVPYTMLRDAVANNEMTKAEADALVDMMERFVRLQVKQSDTAITLDSIPYYSQASDGAKVAGLPQWGLELLQGGASGMVEVAAAITRTQTEMARLLTCEHLMLGEASGNRALSEDKSRNLYLIANAVLGDIVAGVGLDVIPVLCDLNGIPEELRPTPKAEDVAFKDAAAVAEILQKMAQAGATLAPDDPVIEDVRSLMGVSPPPPPSPEMMGLPTDGGGDDDSGVGDPVLEDDEAGVEDEEAVTKAAPRTLYVSRRLLNAGAVRAWASSQGIASALPADDMHVTVAFSREPVDWSELTPQQDAIVVGGTIVVHQFPARNTPNGALVLLFGSPELAARWQELRDAGASWDFPEYSPHVTITYSVPEADVAAIEPYRGPLIFGPEVFAEVNDDWAGEVVEEPLVKAFDPNQPRDDKGQWGETGAGEGGDDAGRYHDVSSKEFSDFRTECLGAHELTRDEQAAVKTYVDTDYAEINRELRSSSGAAGSLPGLDSAIEKSTLKRDIVLYRGVSGRAASFISKMKPGQVLLDHAYVSTALSRRGAESADEDRGGAHLVMKILAPKGAHALPVIGGEVVFPRGSKFKYLGRRGGAATFVVRVRGLSKIKEGLQDDRGKPIPKRSVPRRPEPPYVLASEKKK